MAAAAADIGDPPMPAAAEEAAAAYHRLRSEARVLVERAQWSTDDFDAELPEGDFQVQTGTTVVFDEERFGRYEDKSLTFRLVSVIGPRARFLLRQLEAWAAGYQEVFEIDARLKAEAQAKVATQSTKRGPAGFNP
jgi:hypothetical protein